jgi:hypothetical protein
MDTLNLDSDDEPDVNSGTILNLSEHHYELRTHLTAQCWDRDGTGARNFFEMPTFRDVRDCKQSVTLVKVPRPKGRSISQHLMKKMKNFFLDLPWKCRLGWVNIHVH